MRKLYIFGLVALACIIIGLAFAEQMTFTTYYPAPYGVYNNMVVMNSLGVGTTDPGTARLAIIGGNVGIGTTVPSSLPNCKLEVQGGPTRVEDRFDINAVGDTRPILYLRTADTSATGAEIWGGGSYIKIGKPASGVIPAGKELCITGNGMVGIGTTVPGAKLDVAGNLLFSGNVSGDVTTIATDMGDLQFVTGGDDDDGDIRAVLTTGNRFAVHRASDAASGLDLFTVNYNGAVTWRISHSQLSDYVFEPGYELQSIEEHAKSMWENKHLPGIVAPEKTEDGDYMIELSEDRRGLLEELEKAHIYIEQLNARLKTLEAKLTQEKNNP